MIIKVAADWHMVKSCYVVCQYTKQIVFPLIMMLKYLKICKVKKKAAFLNVVLNLEYYHLMKLRSIGA